LLRAGALTAVAAPLAVPILAACTIQSLPTAPDPLAALLTAADTDVRTAQAAAAAFPDSAPTLRVVATVRQQQADALRAEVNRANIAPTTTTTPPTTDSSPPPGNVGTTMSQLASSLRAAQQQAAALVPTVPRYRAGLVGSVSAGCASLLEALGR
jgi:hypothetical protein